MTETREQMAAALENLVGLSTVLTAINSDENRAALCAGAQALRDTPQWQPIGTETREEDKFDHQSMDALVWAREFCRLNIAADEGVMLAWFASAIMAGFDEATRRAALSPPSADPGTAVPPTGTK